MNEAESQGGPQRMSEEAKGGTPRLFDSCIGATVLALRQVGLSGWQQAECLCLEQELAAWQKAGVRPKGTPGGGPVSPEDLRWWALRFKASLDRALRVAEGYTECLLSLYAHRSQVRRTSLPLSTRLACRARQAKGVDTAAPLTAARRSQQRATHSSAPLTVAQQQQQHCYHAAAREARKT